MKAKLLQSTPYNEGGVLSRIKSQPLHAPGGVIPETPVKIFRPAKVPSEGWVKNDDCKTNALKNHEKRRQRDQKKIHIL